MACFLNCRIYWQAIENTESNNSWGLLQTPFHPKEGPPDIRISKQYWALLQYSRWIRNGSTIIASEDPDTVIATSLPSCNSSRGLVIVTTNFDDRQKAILYDLGAAGAECQGASVDVHRTSACEDCKHLGRFQLPHQQGALLLPFELQPLSITTLVVQLQQPSAIQSGLGGEWAMV